MTSRSWSKGFLGRGSTGIPKVQHICLIMLMHDIRIFLKICGKFPQHHLEQLVMKKVSSDPPDLGGSEEKIRLKRIYAARLSVRWYVSVICYSSIYFASKC